MIVFALASWAVYTALLILLLTYGVRGRRLSLISFATILLITTNLRQILFFTGLDKPHPQNQFMPTEWELISIANFTLITWLVIVLLSYQINAPLGRLIAPLFPARDPQPDLERKPRGVFIAVLVPFIFSVGGTAALIMAFGGFANFTYAVKVSKELQGFYIIRSVGVLTSILAFYAVLSSMNFHKERRAKLPRTTIVYAIMVVLTLAATFAWGNRYTLAMIFLGYMMAWHLYVRRLNLIIIVILGASAIALLQGLKLVRLQLVSNVTGNESTVASNIWLNLSLSLHLVEFDALMLALRDAGTLFDFRGARDFVNGLLSWLPRSIYPAKETFQIGGWFRRIYEPWTVNGWPITTPGSWYVNFAIWGIPIGAWISGIVMRGFDTAFRLVKESAWQASVGPLMALFLIEGGINTGFPQKIFLYFIPLYLVLVWINVLSRKRKSPSTSSFRRINYANGPI